MLVCLLSLVVTTAMADEPTSFTNPVYSENMPDPGVLLHEGTYYAFGTTGDERMPDGRIFRVLTSTNLIDWKEQGGALAPPIADTKKQYWAPEAAYDNGTFYLYYSVGTLDDLRFEIRVATSESPAGPYRDNGVALKEGANAPFFIDGHPFLDDDGQWYFFYAKDFLDTDGGARAGTGIVVDRLLDMTRLAGEPKTVVRPRYDWTLFEADRVMPMLGGKKFDWHTIEAPWVVEHDGKYYCFYSGSNFGTINYGVDYVVADSVTGDYHDQGQYARVLRGVPNLVRGPGHHSIVRTPDGSTDVAVYHAWDAKMTRREMCIDPLVWTRFGPRCVGPSVSPVDLAR
ncbi:glycoside hydrolase family 43 protein [Botrimarina colliarenosi]|uniref:glycoside hydrolase family 43 protein n=1 Tax=Botrimarina colliarenosi TaxID=2528001 RepID=UPI0018D2758C|nr:glycoside hydrolase family 43 protein [Botrimarina colliarenosi]